MKRLFKYIVALFSKDNKKHFMDKSSINNLLFELYSRQFEVKNRLVEQTIRQIIFFLEPTNKDLTEQPNEFGKSLLNGIDIKTDTLTFSIGNRYISPGYGLSIDIGQTKELEYVEEEKNPTNFNTQIVGQTIKEINIYWMNIPFEGEKGIYPQEIELLTDNGYLLLSSIEINNGQVDIEFTNELLIIDKKEVANQLKLGRFGLADNNRKLYKDLNDLTCSA